MTTRLLIVILLLAAFAGGIVLGPKLTGIGADLQDGVAEKTAEREVLYWVAPMDPNFRRDKPGKSPMGMDLVPVYADATADGDAVTHRSGGREQPRRAHGRGHEFGRCGARIEATGYVGFDETRISHINTRVPRLDRAPRSQGRRRAGRRRRPAVRAVFAGTGECPEGVPAGGATR